MNPQEAAQWTQEALKKGRKPADIAADLAVKMGAPPQLTERFVHQVQRQGLAAAAAPPANTAAAPVRKARSERPAAQARPKSPLDDPKWRAYVLKELKNYRRSGDIASHLCEQTGVHWANAQRFVSQIAVDNDQELSWYRNGPILIASVLSILAGLGLLAGGLLLVSNPGAVVRYVRVSGESIQAMIGMFATGLGMVLGGVAGLVRVFGKH